MAELSYASNRKLIKNGDILLYEGSGIISRMIRAVTHSQYSHAGIIAWWNKRLMVLEAVGKGVRTTPLSTNLEHYPGNIVWFSARQALADEARAKIVGFAQQELGKKYARWKAFWLGLGLLFHWDKDRRDKIKREQKLFCSFYVAQAYNSIGLDLKKNVSDSFMLPQDIAESPLLCVKGTLRR
jgi:uncharacterized protein YycO